MFPLIEKMQKISENCGKRTFHCQDSGWRELSSEWVSTVCCNKWLISPSHYIKRIKVMLSSLDPILWVPCMMVYHENKNGPDSLNKLCPQQVSHGTGDSGLTLHWTWGSAPFWHQAKESETRDPVLCSSQVWGWRQPPPGSGSLWWYPGATVMRDYKMSSSEQQKLLLSNLVVRSLNHDIGRTILPLKVVGKALFQTCLLASGSALLVAT
jgi:hypothetical protein